MEVGPIDYHETVIEDIPLFFTVKVDLWLRVRRGGMGVRMGMEKEMKILTPFSLGFLTLANTGTAE
jgi:hypothetical protein